jgi:hypothetical protein
MPVKKSHKDDETTSTAEVTARSAASPWRVRRDDEAGPMTKVHGLGSDDLGDDWRVRRENN